MKNKKFDKKLAAETFFEIAVMIISTFAFAFIVGGMIAGISPVAEAASYFPQGCCIEGKDGSICQNMNDIDKGNCKTGLIATDCNLVDDCRSGCCYNPQEGTCTFNSPKSKCESSGGNWSSSPTCNIQECSLGCCILGDQASITTSRECTKISRDLNFQRNFASLDADGTCNSKVGLTKKGACTTPTGDFSGENDCKFTTKQICEGTIHGTFYESFLCTAKALNTVCYKAKNTTCVQDKDQIYYTDTCGNIANVYDASKFDNQSYWETVMPASSSCSPASASCGNCDYMKGSRCYAYRAGKDTKATYGNNVCRDLNCENGRKHGESWCISDYSNTESSAVAPVGSRWFRGICIDGEISIEACADFNQETCLENVGTGEAGSSFSEARCIVNNWRSCINANNKDNYNAVKQECDKYPDDCTTIFSAEGQEPTSLGAGGSSIAGAAKSGDYSTLPGFRIDLSNSQQGAAGDIGKDANKIVVWCVPKNTPGMVFWTTPASGITIGANAPTTATTQQSQTGIGNGGSLAETSGICSLGSFTCVSHTQKKPAATGSWTDKENWECNWAAENNQQAARTEKVPLLMQALNERCRMLGPCGAQANIAGDLGSSNITSDVTRTKINKMGEQQKLHDESNYALSADYLSSLTEKAGVKKPGSMNTLASAVFMSLITGMAYTGYPLPPLIHAPTGPLGIPIPTGAGGLTGFEIAYGIGQALFYAAMAALMGYQIGQMIGKMAGLSPGRTEALSYALAVGFGVGTGAVSLATYFELGVKFGVWGIIVAAILAIITYIFTGEDNEYYITTYTCNSWSAPQHGDCSACNKDIRPCSEYRCKSLGLNCDYHNGNGEPGYCAASLDVFSATITPWKEALTSGLKYNDVKETRFRIESNNSVNVSAWMPVTFGIITDKFAKCKIDNKHTGSFNEMSTDFAVDTTSPECISGNCVNQGLHHKIALSPNIGTNGTATSTLSLIAGQENNYYVRCKTFSGAANDAEFAVKISVGTGPDYTPPLITGFAPQSGAYLKVSANSSSLLAYVSEPSECRYSQTFNSRYEDMNNSMLCQNDPSMAILGNWPCYATLSNLTAGENKFYFQCQDHPEYPEGSAERRNINRNSEEYTLNVCSLGLNITSLSPREKIITGKSPVSAVLEATTSGCIDGGKATCYYSLTSINSSVSAAFFSTGSTTHTQLFNNMPSGDWNITVKCEDEAGNSANDSLKIKVELDNNPPSVLRTYVFDQKLNIITNENSECKYVDNSSIGCSFNYDSDNSTTMAGLEKAHSAPWTAGREYYIKCRDIFNNTNFDCGIIAKTY